jgi:hypothetical protein
MSQGYDSGPERNPYQAPVVGFGGGVNTTAGGTGAVTAKTVEMLRQTRPWVRFLAVLGFIFAGLMLVVGVFGGLAGVAAGGPTGLIAVLYIPLALIYLVPAIYLNRYAGRIREFEASPRLEQLDNALGAQKSFWRFVGIMMAVLLGLYLLLAVGLIVAAFTGVLRQ